MRHLPEIPTVRWPAVGAALLLAACSAKTPPLPPSADPVVTTTAPEPTRETAAPVPVPATTPTAPGTDASVGDATADTVAPPPATGPGTLPEPPDRPALLPAVPTAPELSPEHARALAAARALRAAGDAAGAARALREAEDEFGESAVLRLEAAWAFFDQASRAFEEGADGFFVKSCLADAHLRVDQADALTPDLPGHAVLLAKLLRYEENPAEARQVLAAHLERFGGDVDAHRELADMAFVARDWAVADTHFSRVAELAPDDGRARLRATIAKQWLAGEGGAAYDAAALHAGYLMAAHLLPEEDEPLKLLVGLYPNSPQQRLAAIDEVLQDNPRAVWARVWKAYLLRQEPGGAEKALEVLDKARSIAPEDAAVASNRAAVLVELDRPLDAVDAYVTALRSADPGTLGGASNELDALLHVSSAARSIEGALRERAYDALCAANPGDGRFGNNAGLWYRDVVHDYEKSLFWYKQAVAVAPDDQDYINDTALIFLFHLRDRKAESLPMFLKVRRLVEEDGQEPIRGYWDTLENLCKYYYEVGQYEKVIECADLRADPSATVNGRPYPSKPAAAYRNQALLKMKK